jgi:hypothetical protein
MGKTAISVTLDADNLLWLRGQAGAAGVRSVSELIDRLVTRARAAGPFAPARSVVGTIDIDAADPLLADADAAVRDLFVRSLRRPRVAKEHSPEYRSPRPRRKRRG